MRIGIKTLVAAMALAAFIVAALPAVASAQPSVDSTEKHFTVAGGATRLVAGTEVKCTSVTGTGEYTGTSPYTTGTLRLAFHGCKSSGFNCTSPGQPAGTITTEPLTFHLVTATRPAGGAAINGILITPNTNGVFGTFTCLFSHLEVKGKGVIGEITTPTNTVSNTLGISFSQGASGKQDLQVVCGTAGTWDLELLVDGKAPETAAQVGTGLTHLTNAATATLT